jgi:hypothetical protein
MARSQPGSSGAEAASAAAAARLAPLLPSVYEGLIGLLSQSKEETLHLVLETLAAVIKCDAGGAVVQQVGGDMGGCSWLKGSMYGEGILWHATGMTEPHRACTIRCSLTACLSFLGDQGLAVLQGYCSTIISPLPHSFRLRLAACWLQVLGHVAGPVLQVWEAHVADPLVGEDALSVLEALSGYTPCLLPLAQEVGEWGAGGWGGTRALGQTMWTGRAFRCPGKTYIVNPRGVDEHY